MAAVTICSDSGAQENKACHCFPIYVPWSDSSKVLQIELLWAVVYNL